MKIFAGFFLFFLPLLYLYPVIIVQKNGDVISGEVVSETAKTLEFKSRYGMITLKKKKIQKIVEKDSLELEEVIVKSQKIQAWYLYENEKEKIYLTRSGLTLKIRKAQSVLKHRSAITFSAGWGMGEVAVPSIVYDLNQDIINYGWKNSSVPDIYNFSLGYDYKLNRFFSLGVDTQLQLVNFQKNYDINLISETVQVETHLSMINGMVLLSQRVEFIELFWPSNKYFRFYSGLKEGYSYSYRQWQWKSSNETLYNSEELSLDISAAAPVLEANAGVGIIILNRVSLSLHGGYGWIFSKKINHTLKKGEFGADLVNQNVDHFFKGPISYAQYWNIGGELAYLF